MLARVVTVFAFSISDNQLRKGEARQVSFGSGANDLYIAQEWKEGQKNALRNHATSQKIEGKWAGIRTDGAVGWDKDQKLLPAFDSTTGQREPDPVG